MKSAPGAPGVSLDAERQRLRQAESEERQDYSRWRDKEIRFREGRTPSPITYGLEFAIQGHSGSLYQENLMGGVSVQGRRETTGSKLKRKKPSGTRR